MRKRNSTRRMALERLETREVLSHFPGGGHFSAMMLRHFGRGGAAIGSTAPGSTTTTNSASQTSSGTTAATTSDGTSSTGTMTQAQATNTNGATTTNAPGLPGSWMSWGGGQANGSSATSATPSGTLAGLGGRGFGGHSDRLLGGSFGAVAPMGLGGLGGGMGSGVAILGTLTDGHLSKAAVQQFQQAFDTFATSYTSGTNPTADQAAWTALRTTVFGLVSAGQQSSSSTTTAPTERVVLSPAAVTGLKNAVDTFATAYTGGTDATADQAAVQALELGILNSVGQVTLSPPATPYTADQLKNLPFFNHQPPTPPATTTPTTTASTTTSTSGSSSTTSTS